MKLLKKLEDQIKTTSYTKGIWKAFSIALDERPDITIDCECRKHIYMQFIELIHDQIENINLLINLKKLVNHNEGKLKVVKMKVFGVEDESKDKYEDYSEIELQIEEREDQLREVEEENSVLDTDINAIKIKNVTIQKEINRNRADEDSSIIEEAIKEAKIKVEELEGKF